MRAGGSVERRSRGSLLFSFFGTLVLAVGVFLSLERDAFGAETEEWAQRFFGVLVSFGPFAAWLGLGEAWEQLRQRGKAHLSSPRASLGLGAVLLVAGVALIALSFRRERLRIECDPASTSVWLGPRPMPCPSTQWLGADDELTVSSPGYLTRVGRVGEFRDGGSVVSISLEPRPPWQCKVLRAGVGVDSRDWCSQRPLFSTRVEIDVEDGKATGTTLEVRPRFDGYVKLQSEGCATGRPRCLAHDPDGAECEGADAEERAATLVVNQSCIGTRRKIVIDVAHCGLAAGPDAGVSFELARLLPNEDPMEVLCED
jgi:hypothetical protein